MAVARNQSSSSSEVLQAQAQLWEHAFNYIDSMSLKCAIELGIPDAIHSHGGPTTVPEILAALSVPPSRLQEMHRLMRLLAHLGIFDLISSGTANGEEDAYALTPVSTLLVKNTGSDDLSLFSLSMVHPNIVRPFALMSDWFRSSGDDQDVRPFSMVHGGGFWDVTKSDPEFNTMFNKGMASDARFLIRVLLRDYGHVFQGIDSLVDVGGGTGAVAVAIAEAFPNLKCSVLDLPQVVSSVGSGGAVEFVAGDMFENIPPANAVFLKCILHDWNNEDCVKILRKCKEAIVLGSREGGGKVIIVEIVLGTNHRSTKAQLYMDMVMLVDLGAQDRGELEWSNIFREAGFQHYKITPTPGIYSVIELYP